MGRKTPPGGACQSCEVSLASQGPAPLMDILIGRAADDGRAGARPGAGAVGMGGTSSLHKKRFKLDVPTGSGFDYTDQGMPRMKPSGPVVVKTVTPMELEEYRRQAELVQDEKAARRYASRDSSRAEMAMKDAWSEWLETLFPGDTWFLTLTYSDANGKRLKAYTPRSCFGDAHRWLKACEYREQSLFVTEPHRWRDILHLHGLLASGSSMPGGDGEAAALARGLWEQSAGFARLSPAVPAAFPYVCKYAMKSGPGAGSDCVDLSGLRRQGGNE